MRLCSRRTSCTGRSLVRAGARGVLAAGSFRISRSQRGIRSPTGISALSVLPACASGHDQEGSYAQDGL